MQIKWKQIWHYMHIFMDLCKQKYRWPFGNNWTYFRRNIQMNISKYEHNLEIYLNIIRCTVGCARVVQILYENDAIMKNASAEYEKFFLTNFSVTLLAAKMQFFKNQL